MSQLRRNGVENKETLGSALDSWAELTGGFDQVGCFGGKKGVFFCLLAAGSLVSYTPGTMALNSCCALSKAAVIFTLMCVDGFLLSLLHSSLWKWHL